MMPETEFILYGISKQSYKFKVYPINIELPSDFGGLYVYTNYTSNGRELIYGGRSVNNLEELETDLLKGNNFIVNTQHNQ